MKFTSIILLIFCISIVSQANSNNKSDNSFVNSALMNTQNLLNKSIQTLSRQVINFDLFILDQENKFNLNKSNRLQIIEKAYQNSLTIDIQIIDDSPIFSNEMLECQFNGTDAMVNKSKLQTIFLCPKSLNYSLQAISQILVHELIHTAESRHLHNECETSFTESLVMMSSGAGNPYQQSYYYTCGFLKKSSTKKKKFSI